MSEVRLALDVAEEKFLAAVRELAEVVGYGRMLQIVAYEWGETHPARAAMERRETIDDLHAAKAADPLARFWLNPKGLRPPKSGEGGRR